MRSVITTAAIALIAVVAYPIVAHHAARMDEAATVEWLHAIGDAQERVRAANGGYAASLDSLVDACPGRAPLLMATLTSNPFAAAGASADRGIVARALVDGGYAIAIRPARGAAEGPPDCHGRPTTADFYVSARPVAVGRDRMGAFAMTSARRVFVFVDGVPPAEEDMAPSGLATPLDELER